MNKGTRELNQTLVKRPVRPSVGKPKILQNLMRLEKKLLVEAAEKRQIMQIQIGPNVGLEHGGYFFTFVAHAGTYPNRPEHQTWLWGGELGRT